MIQLKIVSGKSAGAVVAARHFPVRVGRAASSALQLEDNGVWDQHLQIDFDPHNGFLLNPHPDAITGVNGQHVPATTLLRNGDLIQVGSAQIQFWLGEVRQHGSRFQECLVWAAIALISIGQVALIYWMMTD